MNEEKSRPLEELKNELRKPVSELKEELRVTRAQIEAFQKDKDAQLKAFQSEKKSLIQVSLERDDIPQADSESKLKGSLLESNQKLQEKLRCKFLNMVSEWIEFTVEI